MEIPLEDVISFMSSMQNEVFSPFGVLVHNYRHRNPKMWFKNNSGGGGVFNGFWLPKSNLILHTTLMTVKYYSVVNQMLFNVDLGPEDEEDEGVVVSPDEASEASQMLLGAPRNLRGSKEDIIKDKVKKCPKRGNIKDSPVVNALRKGSNPNLYSKLDNDVDEGRGGSNSDAESQSSNAVIDNGKNSKPKKELLESPNLSPIKLVRGRNNHIPIDVHVSGISDTQPASPPTDNPNTQARTLVDRATQTIDENANRQPKLVKTELNDYKLRKKLRNPIKYMKYYEPDTIPDVMVQHHGGKKIEHDYNRDEKRLTVS